MACSPVISFVDPHTYIQNNLHKQNKRAPSWPLTVVKNLFTLPGDQYTCVTHGLYYLTFEPSTIWCCRVTHTWTEMSPTHTMAPQTVLAQSQRPPSRTIYPSIHFQFLLSPQGLWGSGGASVSCHRATLRWLPGQIASPLQSNIETKSFKLLHTPMDSPEIVIQLTCMFSDCER